MILSRIIMTVVTIALLSPFVFLFGSYCVLPRKDEMKQSSTLETDVGIERKTDSENEEIQKAGQPGIVGWSRETWVSVWPQLGLYGMFGPHYGLGIPGLLVVLGLLGIVLYCIWRPRFG